MHITADESRKHQRLPSLIEAIKTQLLKIKKQLLSDPNWAPPSQIILVATILNKKSEYADLCGK